MTAARDELLEHLRKKIRQIMNDVTDDVATGSCTDFSAYRFLTGIIEGLARAERELLDIDEMQYRGDDD